MKNTFAKYLTPNIINTLIITSYYFYSMIHIIDNMIYMNIDKDL